MLQAACWINNLIACTFYINRSFQEDGSDTSLCRVHVNSHRSDGLCPNISSIPVLGQGSCLCIISDWKLSFSKCQHTLPSLQSPAICIYSVASQLEYQVKLFFGNLFSKEDLSTLYLRQLQKTGKYNWTNVAVCLSTCFSPGDRRRCHFC